MQIYGPTHVHGPQHVNAPHAIRQPAGVAPTRGAQAAELSISAEANFVSLAAQLPEMRMDRVQALREQIASGAYETNEKLDIALERLLDEIA